MRQVTALLAGLALLTLAGCGSMNPYPQHVYSKPPSERAQSGTLDPKTRPYTVLGRTYYPLQTPRGYDEVGLASWYGRDFHGKKTANGQIYNMYGVSAAHKTLPLGSRVRVTNLENERSVVLVINDRGPFVNQRILDLSYGAAKKLGTVDRGVAKVRVTALDSWTRGPRPSGFPWPQSNGTRCGSGPSPCATTPSAYTGGWWAQATPARASPWSPATARYCTSWWPAASPTGIRRSGSWRP